MIDKNLQEDIRKIIQEELERLIITLYDTSILAKYRKLTGKDGDKDGYD